MRIVIVGAGLSGLHAARTLQQAGHSVTVLDKGRSPGGRMATRRVGPARLDHGAQFFTARSETFRQEVARWVEVGLVHEWCRGFGPDGDGHPRYAARAGMTTLTKYLADGVDVRCSSLVFAVRPGAQCWDVCLDDATSIPADALIVTCPLPQAFSVLVSSDVEIPQALRETEYDRTLSILVTLDRPGAIPAPGGLQNPDDVFGFIGDNVSKGVSEHPAITFHANAEWSETHWDDEREASTAALLAHARPWLGDAQVLEVSPKRWRFATPRTIWPTACWTHVDGAAPLVLAGDAFAGPRVEGAVLSGLAAAAALIALS
ncbi:MAG: FAD-dependent oxidoreductase [Actinobacteria bacterium]|nr:FAD-dependent oxidoreductase [Actinomycetota bacterium]MSY12861.1 FAD-dependent oxidoreductase [Actinomycetota bacterium]MSZ04700.1 FAD-dependent oxidoreductase [Actinomycetota bacterium]MTB08093.1 FAD-dependent oxidoreductase [Actinomycetota bacterium]